MSKVLPWLLALVLGCSTPPLTTEPWQFAQPGATAVGLRPGLFTVYEIEGEFTSRDFSSGMESTVGDSGDIVGRFGAALRGERFLTENDALFLGIDYRVYDIEHFNPIPELDIEIESIDSLQLYAGLRHLFAPFESRPRWRPFVQVALAWLPGVEVAYEVDLSSFGSSNLGIDTDSEGYWVGGVSTGLLYHWRDRWVFELGLLYEFPITNLEADLGFEISGSNVPLDAELEPSGFIGFWGLSYYL